MGTNKKILVIETSTANRAEKRTDENCEKAINRLCIAPAMKGLAHFYFPRFWQREAEMFGSLRVYPIDQQQKTFEKKQTRNP